MAGAPNRGIVHRSSWVMGRRGGCAQALGGTGMARSRARPRRPRGNRMSVKVLPATAVVDYGRLAVLPIIRE
ncbi:hypothetical protein TBR22_A43580 [Luteitalea sp. TBR-22]|nr:hypothetical protein TBR22_A43580 [Luteitalea sp. TBR-22]